MFAASKQIDKKKGPQRKNYQLTFDLLGYHAGVVVEVSHHFVEHAAFRPVGVSQVSILTQVDGVAAGNLCCVCVGGEWRGRKRKRERERGGRGEKKNLSNPGAELDPKATHTFHQQRLLPSSTATEAIRSQKKHSEGN